MVDILRVTGGATAVSPSTTFSSPANVFDTVERNDGYTWDAANSRVTLPATIPAGVDGYAIVAMVEYEDTSNGRHNPQARITQNSGTGDFLSAATSGYNRDNSEDRSYVETVAFVNGPSGSASFDWEWRRDTDAPTGGTVRATLEVIPLAYTNHGLYTSTQAASPGGTTTTPIGSFTAVSESDTAAIELTGGNLVTVKGDNKRYLLIGSYYWQGIGSSRTQRWGGFEIDGVYDEAMQGYTYYRNGNNADGGEVFSGIIETTTADRTVENVNWRKPVTAFPTDGGSVTGNTTGVNPIHTMIVLELDDACEVFMSRNASQQNIRTAGSRVELNVTPASGVDFNDAAAFTRADDNGMNIEQDDDYFFGANISGGYGANSSARYTGFAEFTINGVGQADYFAGDYGRGSQGGQNCWGWSANLMGAFAMTTGQDIGVNAGKITGGEGGLVDVFNGHAGFWGIRLGSMAGGGQTVVTSSGAANLAAITASGAADVTAIETASGSASIAAITAAGGAKIVKQASGTAQAPLPTASGSAAVGSTLTSSGSATLAPATASGAAAVRKTASGAVSLASVTAAGAALRRAIAAGGSSIPSITASGSAGQSVTRTASGSATLAPVTATGSAIIRKQAGGEGTPAQLAVDAAWSADVRDNGFESFPNDGSDWVGVNGTGPLVEYRTAQKFDISGIPANATITNVQLEVFLDGVEQSGPNGDTFAVGPYNGDGQADPQTDTAANLFARTDVAADNYITGITFPAIGARTFADLGAQAEADLQAAISGGIFSVGWQQLPTQTVTGRYVFFRESFQVSPPRLTVDYTLPGGADIPAVTASGAASVGSVTAASGNANLPNIASNGTAKINKAASGAASVPVSTANGAASVRRQASGSAAIPAILAAGSSLGVTNASGDASIAAITADGTAITVKRANGAPVIPGFVASGSASSSKPASGSANVPIPVIAGTAFLRPWVFLNTSQTLVGATRLEVTAASPDGTSVTFNDSLEGLFGPLFLGVQNRNTLEVGWLPVTVEELTNPSAFGNVDTPITTASGAVDLTRSASGSATLPSLVASGASTVTRVGTGSPALPAVSASGAAFVKQIIPASGTASISALEASGTVRLIRNANGDASISAPFGSGAVQAGQFKVASGNADIPAFVASATAGVARKASGVAQTPNIEASASAFVVRRPFGAVSVPGFDAAGIAKVRRIAGGAAVLPTIEAAAIGRLGFNTSGAATIAPIEVSGSALVGGVVVVSTFETVGYTIDLTFNGYTLDLAFTGRVLPDSAVTGIDADFAVNGYVIDLTFIGRVL